MFFSLQKRGQNELIRNFFGRQIKVGIQFKRPLTPPSILPLSKCFLWRDSYSMRSYICIQKYKIVVFFLFWQNLCPCRTASSRSSFLFSVKQLLFFSTFWNPLSFNVFPLIKFLVRGRNWSCFYQVCKQYVWDLLTQ